MFDILMFLFESYVNVGSYPEPDKLSIKLSAAGFVDEEIEQALDWVDGMKRLSMTDYPAAINHSGIRQYADYEQERISTEGLSFLTFAEQTGMVTAVEREMILDRSLSLGEDYPQLSLENMKLLTLLILWNQHENLDPLLVEELLTSADASQLH